MAVTIEQSPGSPKYSRSPIQYNVSSDNINETSFSFIVDYYIGTTRIARRRKTPNPVGHGIINVNNIIDSNLDYDLPLGSATDTLGAESTKTFQIRFGEEYLVMTSDNELTIFPDLAIGDNITVVKGSLDTHTGLLSDPAFSGFAVLSDNNVRHKVQRDDTLTISRYNDDTNALIHHNVTIPATGNNVTVEVVAASGTIPVLNADLQISDTDSFYINERYAWTNSKGGWDYFNLSGVETEQRSNAKSTYATSEILQGRATTTNRESMNSNVFRSGLIDYRIEYDTVFTKMSTFLDDDEATLLDGMFDSPRVYKQIGDVWAQIEVLNNSRAVVKRQRRPANFKQNLMYRFKNNQPTI